MNRPTLSDPEEYAIIKSMFFDTQTPYSEDIDPYENLERQESRFKNLNKNSR